MPTAMQSDMNSLQFVNFNTEFGWNEVEANLLGVTGIFSGNTPISTIRASIDSYINAFTFQDDPSKLPDSTIPKNKPKFCADKEGKIVPCDSPDRVEGGKSGISLRDILGLPPVTGDVLCSDCTEEQLEQLRKTGTVSGGGSGLFKIPGVESGDIGKKIFLLLLGFGLIILSVYILVK